MCMVIMPVMINSEKGFIVVSEHTVRRESVHGKDEEY